MEEISTIEPKQSEISIAAKRITDGLVIFEKRKADLVELAKQAEGIKITSLEDRAIIKQASECRKKLKSARVEIEKEGKAMRDPLTAVNKEISAKEKELVSIISPAEIALEEQEAWVKAEEFKIEQEAERKEQERIQARIDRLAEYGYAIDLTLLKGIDDETFEKTVESARVEWQKEQDAIAEKARLDQEAKEQAEKDRLELQRLRKQQEEADRVIKEQQDKIEKDRIEKARRDKLETERLAKEVEAVKQREEREKLLAQQAEIKVIKDAAFEVRKDQLIKMGFVTYGVDFSLKDTWSCYWEQIYNPSDEDWASYVVAIEEAIERRKVTLAEEEKQRAIDLEKARLKGIADEKEAQRQTELKRQEELAKAGDKAIWADFISKLKALPVPTMNSPQYRRMAATSRDKLLEVYNLKP